MSVHIFSSLRVSVVISSFSPCLGGYFKFSSVSLWLFQVSLRVSVVISSFSPRLCGYFKFYSVPPWLFKDTYRGKTRRPEAFDCNGSSAETTTKGNSYRVPLAELLLFCTAHSLYSSITDCISVISYFLLSASTRLTNSV